MSKTILLIENDAAFASELCEALEAMGYGVRVTGDGKDGFDLAGELKPDAIVLCVELPKMSGYSICNKLKKDDVLKGVPLILTSSEATDEVFDDHKKLKVRAEEYLLKPFVPATLLEKLAGLIGLPEGAATARPAAAARDEGEEELVSLEEELGLEQFAGEPEQELAGLDLDSLPDEPTARTAGSPLDDDLKLLDDAFDGLSAPSTPAAPPARAAPPALTPVPLPGRGTSPVVVPPPPPPKPWPEPAPLELDDRGVDLDDVAAAAASLPTLDERAPIDPLSGFGDDDLSLAALDTPGRHDDVAAAALDALDGPPPSRPPPAALEPRAPGGPSSEALARLQNQLEEQRAALAARDGELKELRSRTETLARRLEKAETALGGRDAELTALRSKADSASSRAQELEKEGASLREQARRAAEAQRAAEEQARQAGDSKRASDERTAAAEARTRAAEAEGTAHRRAAEQSASALATKAAELVTALAAAARLTAVEREKEKLETELLVARGEVDGARSEVDKRAGDLKKRIQELEAANSKNEERVVKAYLKIKGDEKVRDKARKALAIALQLLEEGLPPESSTPRPAAGLPKADL